MNGYNSFPAPTTSCTILRHQTFFFFFWVSVQCSAFAVEKGMTLKRLRRDQERSSVVEQWADTLCSASGTQGSWKALEGSGREARECSCLRRPLLVLCGGEDYVLVIAIVVTDAHLTETEDMLWLMVSVWGQLVPLLWAWGDREHRESRSRWRRKRHDAPGPSSS